MTLTRLLLGLVLSSGLFFFAAACGSSDSSDNNSPFGDGGGTGGSGGVTTTSSGNWTCSDAMTCKNGKLQMCCTDTQCKYVLGSKEYPCTGQTDCQSSLTAALGQCM